MSRYGKRLWIQWVLANAWGEAAGLGAAGLVGVAIVALMGENPGAVLTVLASLVLIAAGTFEGAVVGFAQWRVLRKPLASIARTDWILATALGAFIAWSLGMLPSTIMSLFASPDSAGGADNTMAQISDAMQLMLAAGLGAILGPILALVQYRVLRAHLKRSGWWIPANAVAWMLGMPMIFIAAGGIAGSGVEPVVVALAGIVTAAVAGAIVGAVHGLALVWLLNRQHEEARNR
jgi:hypothetical protein